MQRHALRVSVFCLLTTYNTIERHSFTVNLQLFSNSSSSNPLITEAGVFFSIVPMTNNVPYIVIVWTMLEVSKVLTSGLELQADFIVKIIDADFFNTSSL
jgi:hypothetical protein